VATCACNSPPRPLTPGTTPPSPPASPPTWTATRALWTSPPSPTPAAARRPSWIWAPMKPRLWTSLGKAVAPPTAVPGQAVTFTLTLSNTGSLPASGIVVTDTLPATLSGLSFHLHPGGDRYRPHPALRLDRAGPGGGAGRRHHRQRRADPAAGGGGLHQHRRYRRHRRLAGGEQHRCRHLHRAQCRPGLYQRASGHGNPGCPLHLHRCRRG
jgi:uncharacterized repeat protein (TIGR01451 family)